MNTRVNININTNTMFNTGLLNATLHLCRNDPVALLLTQLDVIDDCVLGLNFNSRSSNWHEGRYNTNINTHININTNINTNTSINRQVVSSSYPSLLNLLLPTNTNINTNTNVNTNTNIISLKRELACLTSKYESLLVTHTTLQHQHHTISTRLSLYEHHFHDKLLQIERDEVNRQRFLAEKQALQEMRVQAEERERERVSLLPPKQRQQHRLRIYQQTHTKRLTKEQCNALVRRCWNENDFSDVLRLDSEGYDIVSVSGVDNFTILMCAAGWEHYDIVNLLITNGADVNAVNTNGYTALMYNCSYNSNVRLVQLLIDNGADVGMRHRDGWTAVMLNCSNFPNTQVLEVLIKEGACVNAVQKDGWSALSFARDNDAVEVVQLLLSHGAR